MSLFGNKRETVETDDILSGNLLLKLLEELGKIIKKESLSYIQVNVKDPNSIIKPTKDPNVFNVASPAILLLSAILAHLNMFLTDSNKANTKYNNAISELFKIEKDKVKDELVFSNLNYDLFNILLKEQEALFSENDTTDINLQKTLFIQMLLSTALFVITDSFVFSAPVDKNDDNFSKLGELQENYPVLATFLNKHIFSKS